MSTSTYSIQLKHVKGGGWQDTGLGRLTKEQLKIYWREYSHSTAIYSYRVMLHREQGDPVQYRTSAPYKPPHVESTK